MGLRTHIWRYFRKRINDKNRARLTNREVSIIASTCNGGVIYKELGLPFHSPTVNLFFHPKDFLRFCSDLKRYVDAGDELVQIESQKPYPVGRLIDVEMHFMHYTSFEEAKEKWLERSKRICWDNIVLMFTDRDGCTYEDIEAFDKLPYKKVIFTNKEYPDIKSHFYIKGFEQDESVGILSCRKDRFGRRYLDDFDYVSFLNIT